MNVALSNASFKKLMETDWTVVHIFMTIELSSGWQNVYVYAYVYICVWVRVCSFVECWGCWGIEAETFPRVLSGGRLYAAERTEGKKREGISGLFVL